MLQDLWFSKLPIKTHRASCIIDMSLSCNSTNLFHLVLYLTGGFSETLHTMKYVKDCTFSSIWFAIYSMFLSVHSSLHSPHLFQKRQRGQQKYFFRDSPTRWGLPFHSTSFHCSVGKTPLHYTWMLWKRLCQKQDCIQVLLCLPHVGKATSLLTEDSVKYL